MSPKPFASRSSLPLFFFFASSLLMICIWNISVGAVAIPPRTIINTLFGFEGETQNYIIWKSRMPRLILALVCGGALALSGAIIQAVIRNPLTSPGIVGINSGAALFVVGAATLIPDFPAFWSPVAACLGGVVAASIVIITAHKKSVSAAHLALIGVAVGFVFSAGVDFFIITADDGRLSAPLIWLTGSLWGRTWSHVHMSALPLVALAGLSLMLFHRLDLMRLGDTTATSLGINVPRQKLVLLYLATILASVSVSVVGVVGFIGLMAPHIARRIVGGTHRLLLPLSALIGMILLVLADGIGRAIAPPIEVSAGILASMIGAPFFIYIMITSTREQNQ